MRKICIKLEIPILGKSYWGKKRAGKTPTKRKLPKYDGDNEYKVYINDWAVKRREQRKEDSLRGFNDEEKENQWFYLYILGEKIKFSIREKSRRT